MSLGRMKVGRHRGWRERERERSRNEIEWNGRGREGGSREESERERGRLASQFPAARAIFTRPIK